MIVICSLSVKAKDLAKNEDLYDNFWSILS